MLLDLCPDLLYDIGTQLVPSDQKRLRSVCQGLNDVLQPLACSHLVLKLTEEALCDEMLDRISSGSTGWSRWATTLRILPGVHEYGHAAAAAIVPVSQAPVLKGALMSLGKLHTITWKIHMEDPEWTRDIICAFLGVVPGLRDLQLEMISYRTNADIPLGIIRGLTKFTAATVPNNLVPQIAKNIAENRYTLTSLHLVRNRFLVEIWKLLISDSNFHALRLMELTTDVVTLHLLKYLSSYSGLRRLNFIRAGGRDQDESNELADVFFETVLPRHEDSLAELSCPADYESRWSFGRHCEDEMSGLHKVESLKLSVNAADIWSGVQPQNNTVHMLLSLAPRLVSLSHLCIVGAGAEHLRRATCGNPKMNHRTAVNLSIDAAVASFRTEISSMATVNAGRKWYTLRPMSIVGNATTELGDVQAQGPTDGTTILAYEEFDHPDSAQESYYHLFY